MLYHDLYLSRIKPVHHHPKLAMQKEKHIIVRGPHAQYAVSNRIYTSVI